MSLFDILCNLFVGVISGIISSLAITLYYRKKDEEKDRQFFFCDVRSYVNRLAEIDSNDINAIALFLSTNEFPRVFPWIKLNKNESNVVYEVHSHAMDLQKAILEYQVTTMSVGMSQQEKSQYQIHIFTDFLDIIEKRMDVDALGRPDFTKELERLRKKLHIDSTEA